MAQLCFGGLHSVSDRMTAELYHSLTPRQRHFITWHRGQARGGSTQYTFLHTPSWLRHSSKLGLEFMLAACGQEDAWQGRSFSTLLAHSSCPLCQCEGFLAMPQWEHLLCTCSVSVGLAESWGLGFLPAACR